jgi:hypothetical protein
VPWSGIPLFPTIAGVFVVGLESSVVSRQPAPTKPAIANKITNAFVRIMVLPFFVGSRVGTLVPNEQNFIPDQHHPGRRPGRKAIHYITTRPARQPCLDAEGCKPLFSMKRGASTGKRLFAMNTF